MLKGTAKLKVEHGGLRAVFSSDFLRYYLWLFTKATYNTIAMNTTKFGAHVSVTLEGVHDIPLAKLFKYAGRQIEFYYDPRAIYSGGARKGFLGYYMPIESDDIIEIRKELDIKNDERQKLHITLFNDKVFRKQKNMLTE